MGGEHLRGAAGTGTWLINRRWLSMTQINERNSTKIVSRITKTESRSRRKRQGGGGEGGNEVYRELSLVTDRLIGQQIVVACRYDMSRMCWVETDTFSFISLTNSLTKLPHTTPKHTKPAGDWLTIKLSVCDSIKLIVKWCMQICWEQSTKWKEKQMLQIISHQVCRSLKTTLLHLIEIGLE